MGFDPFSIALGGLFNAGSQALEVLPYLKKTDQDKHNEAELAKLQHLEQNGGFGITSGEQTAIRGSTVDPALHALQAQPMANSPIGTQIAQQLAQNVARAGAIGDLQNQAESTILGADYARKQEQRQELEDRLAYESQRKKDKAAAIASIINSALTGGIGGGQSTYLNPTRNSVPGSTTFQPDSAGSPGTSEVLKQLPPEVAGMLSNPELASTLPLLLA